MAYKRGNPYHDSRGRFTTAHGCSSVSLYKVNKEDMSDDAMKIKKENAALIDNGVEGYREQYKKEIENGAEIIVYNDDKGQVRYGIVDVENIDKRTMETGGASTEIRNNNIPTDGYMIAAYSDRETWLSIEDSNNPAIRKQKIYEFAEKNKDVLTKPNMHLGTWLDPESGKICLDISERDMNEESAKAKGRQRNQKAIFNLKTFEDINTGGTGNNNT